jgi:hypothetical protein
MAETTVLVCPKCPGAMRTHDRGGILDISGGDSAAWSVR